MTGKIPIKIIDREKNREDEIHDNRLESLFIKEPIILEDIPDDKSDRVHMFGGSPFKEKKNGAFPLPHVKNNFIESHETNNIEVLKVETGSASTNLKRNSVDASINVRQNKSYVIEKESEMVSPIERKNYSTIVKGNENVEGFLNLPKSTNKDAYRTNSKSNDNIKDVLPKESNINESFKTVKSENNGEESKIQFFNQSEGDNIHYIKKWYVFFLLLRSYFSQNINQIPALFWHFKIKNSIFFW